MEMIRTDHSFRLFRSLHSRQSRESFTPFFRTFAAAVVTAAPSRVCFSSFSIQNG